MWRHPLPQLVTALVVLFMVLPPVAAAGPRNDVHLDAETLERAEDGVGGPSYTVVRGDTLGEIAERFDLSIQQLCQWNAGLDPDRIREGQVLAVGPEGREVRHEIQQGETLTEIAHRYEVPIRDLVRWNRGLRPDHIRAGRRLTVYTRVPLSRSQSIGTPNRGHLVEGIALPKHPGYVIRTPERAFGTEETVRNIVRGFEKLRKRFPRAPKVKVHDLSLADGGPMHQHRSHQSGRDADIAYFQDECKAGICAFRPVGPGTIDARRNWALLHHWLTHHQLEAVFIDYKLQRVLYRQARKEGASKEDLARWFQYPRGRTHPSGVIRHFPKHHDHMHVRFACHGSDPECKTLRPLITGAEHASN